MSAQARLPKLVTKSDDAAEMVRDTMASLLKQVTDENYTAMATVLIRHDGRMFVSHRSNGNRALLLGAVTDLQYTIAKDGDG